VALTDLLKASDEDLEALYPGDSIEQAVRRLLEMGPSAVVVTRGRDGATWFGRDTRVDVPSRDVEVADTIGAGDAFQAALLDALVQPATGIRIPTTVTELTSVLHRCVTAGAIACTRHGARPPTRGEINTCCLRGEID
jgi:fructokinase